MGRRFVSCVFAAALASCLLAGGSQIGMATVVFDDHFTGSSGGMPAGWHLLFGPGTVVESGTTVLFTNDVVIASDGVFDPTQGDVALSVEIALLTGTSPAAMMALVNGSLTRVIFADLELADGKLRVVAIEDGVEQPFVAGYLSGYEGGPIRMTLALGPVTFSLSTDDPLFSTGPIDYASAFPTFTRDDLDTASHVCVGGDSQEELDTDWCRVDRITVDIVPPVPVESLSFGQIKALYRR